MRLFSIVLTGVLLLQNAIAQSDQPSSYTQLMAEISTLPDTTQFERLSTFLDEKLAKVDFAEAGLAVNELMTIARRNSDQILTGRAYSSMGSLERDKNNSSQAVLYFQQAYNIFRKIGAYEKQIRTLRRICHVYIALRQITMAEQYAMKALEISQLHKVALETAYIYDDLATVEDLRKNFKKAIELERKSVSVIRSLGESPLYSLVNLGIKYKNAGLYQQSEETYRHCLKEAIQTKNEVVKGYIYANLPNTLLLLNRPEEAEYYARLALDWSLHQPGKQMMLREIYETFTQIYEKKGQYQQALHSHKQWAAYRDSVLNAEKSQQLVVAEARFEAKEKEQQIRQLAEFNTLRTRQLWGVTVGAAILLALLGLALWQYRIIRRVNQQVGVANQLMHERNQRISEQSHQLKELMKELHHRVKNNLAIVASLLRLQSNRLTDQGAAEAVREGQRRVEAMSLIHQRLYQTDNPTRVDLEPYLRDLVQGLLQAYHYQGDFDLDFQVVPVEVEVELAIPIGLVVNELVTNAFKHAYQHTGHPRLGIRLWQAAYLYVEVEDNGPGINMAQWTKPGGSFGKRLVTSLVEQVNGQIEITTSGGSCFRIVIPATVTKNDFSPYSTPMEYVQ